MKFPEPARARFVAAITMLAEAFGRQTSKAMLAAYEAGLCDLPIVAVEGACLFAIRTCKFMPTVAELRSIEYQLGKAARWGRGGDGRAAMPSGISPDPRQTAERAWLALSFARDNFWWCGSITFDDLAINATVRCTGGWQRLLTMPDEQFHSWYRKDFIASYLANHHEKLDNGLHAPLMSTSQNGDAIRINADLSVSRSELAALPAKSEGWAGVGPGGLGLEAIGKLE